MKSRYRGCYRGPRFVKITLLNGRLILCKWSWRDWNGQKEAQP